VKKSKADINKVQADIDANSVPFCGVKKHRSSSQT
jgi:hypothetical protein